MDESSERMTFNPRYPGALILLVSVLAAGCSTYIGTTAKSFLHHVRDNPDPNVRYLAYSKLSAADVYDSPDQKDEAVRTLMEKFANGREPVASRAMICRTLGELRDPRARELLIRAASSQDAVVKIEACRALGKVGLPEDATVLAQVMTLDNLEDARIAAIDGLGEMKTSDVRIHKQLIEGMEHEDPAIRLASLNALRKVYGKDLGTEAEAWRKAMLPAADQASPATIDSSTSPAAAPARASNR